MNPEAKRLPVNRAAAKKRMPLISSIQRVGRIGRLLFSVSVLAAIASASSVSATVRYVDLNNGSPTPPYTNWVTAATNIQHAVDAADAGDEILVTNGVYQSGGTVIAAVTNRVAVARPLVVQSVNGPQFTVISGAGTLRCAYLTNGASLSGFTLTNGVAANYGGAGGGVYCESTSAVLSNCVLSSNSANGNGGGAYSGTLNNCTLTGNSAGGSGGADHATLNNCTLTGNLALSRIGGGANYCTLNNCTLTGNIAYQWGGGAGNSVMNNCTLAGNSAWWGSGGSYGGELRNCIVYYNTAPSGPNQNDGTFLYCCTTPLPASGTGNFTNAPLFVDLAKGDLRLQTNSPCIDAGTNTYAVGTNDLAGRPRIVGGTVDVGAYEFQGSHLSVVASAGGSVAQDPDLSDYPVGCLVTLTAKPDAGYGFIRWSGDATGSTNPVTVSMDSSMNVTSVFASTALTLASQGVGTITKVPDQTNYAVGDQVTLTATPGRWQLFSGWADGNTNNPRAITIGESNVYTAVFTNTTPLETVTIGGVSRLAPVGMPAVVVDGTFILAESVSVRGSATVTLTTTFPGSWLFYTVDGSDPAASGAFYSGPFTVGQTSLLRSIAYNADFTRSVAGNPVTIVVLPTLTGLTAGGGSVAIEPPAGDYFSNSMATVTATPAQGWTFLQWLGDATGTNLVVNVHMTRDMTVRAMFGTTLNMAVVGGGSIVVSPVSPWQPYGNNVRLTAVPAMGNYLAFWANAASGATDNPLTLAVTNANPTVTAVFASLAGTGTNSLTVIPDGRGQVALTPPGNLYALNTSVVLQATPDAGQEFIGWSGDASGSENPLIVTMNLNKVIMAKFTKRPRLEGENNPEFLGQEGFRLTLTGEIGVTNEVFGSTDLSNWSLLGTVTNTWGTVQFTDPEAATNAHRAYRARVVE
jgi:hypothetical protein